MINHMHIKRLNKEKPLLKNINLTLLEACAIINATARNFKKRNINKFSLLTKESKYITKTIINEYLSNNKLYKKLSDTPTKETLQKVNSSNLNEIYTKSITIVKKAIVKNEIPFKHYSKTMLFNLDETSNIALRSLDHIRDAVCDELTSSNQSNQSNSLEHIL